MVYYTLRYTLFVIGISISVLCSAQGLSVSTSTLTFEGSVGEVVTKSLIVRNLSTDKSYTFRAVVFDWERDSIGTKVLSPFGSLAYGMKDELELHKTMFLLGPLQTESFFVSYRIPSVSDDLKHTRSAMLILRSHLERDDLEEKDDVGAIGIELAYSFGIQLAHTPIGTFLGEIEIDEIELLAIDGADKCRVMYMNSGYVHMTGFLRVEITNISTGQEYKLSPLPFAITPRGHQQKDFRLPEDLQKGIYQFVVVLDTQGDSQVKVASKEIIYTEE